MTRTFLILALALAPVALAAAKDACPAPSAEKNNASTKHQSPFACDRLALSPEARKRHFDELGPQLRSRIQSARELRNGYAFQFAPEPATVLLAAEWAAGERLCCPFFDISMHMEPEHGAFWLVLTGRSGTKEFIQVDGAEWIKAANHRQ